MYGPLPAGDFPLFKKGNLGTCVSSDSSHSLLCGANRSAMLPNGIALLRFKDILSCVPHI